MHGYLRHKEQRKSYMNFVLYTKGYEYYEVLYKFIRQTKTHTYTHTKNSFPFISIETLFVFDINLFKYNTICHDVRLVKTAFY